MPKKGVGFGDFLSSRCKRGLGLRGLGFRFGFRFEVLGLVVDQLPRQDNPPHPETVPSAVC